MGAGDWYHMALQTAEQRQQAQLQAVEQKVHAILETTAATVEELATRPAAFEESERQVPELEWHGPAFRQQEMNAFRHKMQKFTIQAADALQREALQMTETEYVAQQDGFLDTLTNFLQEMWAVPELVAAADSLVQNAVLRAVKSLEARLRIPRHLTIRLLRTVIQSLQTELAKPAYLKAAETRGRVFGIPTAKILEQDQKRLEAAVRSDRMPFPYGRS